MTTVRHEWWVTPVWEIETGFDLKFNQDLLVEISQCTPPTNPYSFNIWDYKTKNITELNDFILKSVYENVREYFDYNFNAHLTRGWINRQFPGQSLSLHDHGGCMLACVYYIDTPTDAGDLQLVDPRGSVNWQVIRDGNVNGVKYKRITPKTGKLVLFPGYLLHQVETNKSKNVRISLATNIMFNLPK
jgi:uncharacterized protein (TIGR02466 family)